MMAECEVSKAQLAEAEALLTKLKASFQEVSSSTLRMPAARPPPHTIGEQHPLKACFVLPHRRPTWLVPFSLNPTG